MSNEHRSTEHQAKLRRRGEQVANLDIVDERVVVFWDIATDREQLSHTTRFDAVEDWLNNDLGEQQRTEALAAGSVTVYGFARMVVPDIQVANEVDYALSLVLENLGEEFGSMVDDSLGIIDDKAMAVAKVEFARAIKAAYEPWTCEQVTTEQYDLAPHLEAGV